MIALEELAVTDHNEAARAMEALLAEGLPHPSLPTLVNDWRQENEFRLRTQARRLTVARELGLPTFFGALHLGVLKASGEYIDYGLASLRVVTNNAVSYIVQVFIATGGYSLNNFKYHGIGTSSTAESASDTTLGTELTTQYASDNTRATGTTIVGGGANIFRSVATNTVDAGAAIVEHGVLTQAANSGGTLLDRSVFGVITLASGDGLTSTYDLTLSAGG